MGMPKNFKKKIMTGVLACSAISSVKIIDTTGKTAFWLGIKS